MIDRTASMGAFATAQDRAECPLPGQANPPNKDRHGSKSVIRRWSANDRSCEGFRMPALCRGLPSGRDGAGVRKPPRKETASRKGAYPPHALWGFESRQRLLASGRNDH